MTKADDSSLDPEQLRAVQIAARRALHRASGWGVYPTPIGDILDAAKIQIAPASVFDPQKITAYLAGKTELAAVNLKSAVSKVLGLLDVDGSLIHVDHTVRPSKQNFLKLHEAGHHQLPWHRKIFRIFPDCEKTLAPEVADQFEREANNFARFVLFQGDGYREMAAAHPMQIRTPMKLAAKFGASIYASCREYARTHHAPCAIYVLEPVEAGLVTGPRAKVRRIEVSEAFAKQFGRPADTTINHDHALGRLLPNGRRMTRPTTISISDRNGQAHECLAEAFDTTFNVLILLHSVKALTAKVFIM